MSTIKEALERVRGSSTEERQGALRPFDDGIYLESDYNKKVLEAGLSILREAGAQKLLAELAEIIRPDFPDVKIEEELMANGMVSSMIVWNRTDEPTIGSFIKYRESMVAIVAEPLTSNLVVRGRDFTLLDRSQWSSDSTLLEDAIARAYDKPMSMLGPPVRI